RLRGVKNSKSQVTQVLERVHLLDRQKTLVRNLSKGMRQRLGLAQALVHDPEVIILDEPTIGIDPQQVIEVRDSVRELGKKHTILFSTHILSEAEQVCDRVVIINKGQIIAEGTPANLRQKLQRGNSLYVQIVGANLAQATDMLSGVAGFESLTAQGEGYILRTRNSNDVRGQIAERVVQSGYRLVELRPVAMTLEDIFLDLVGRE
ncbi:MAG: ABC transporter ATP-binding protein, partial [Anaerolineae bacterium]|nr:ABC transporter ATP-binding protein [Anaerolineae bacterium]